MWVPSVYGNLTFERNVFIAYSSCITTGMWCTPSPRKRTSGVGLCKEDIVGAGGVFNGKIYGTAELRLVRLTEPQ